MKTWVKKSPKNPKGSVGMFKRILSPKRTASKMLRLKQILQERRLLIFCKISRNFTFKQIREFPG